MATTGYDVLSGLKAVPVAKPTAVTPASIAAAQAAVAATEKIAAKTETKAVRAADPLTNKSVVPDAPAGTTPVWVGGTDTGGWKFQSNQNPIQQNGSTTDTNTSATTDALAKLQAQQDAAVKQDAFKLIEDVFNQYGLGSLATKIADYMKQNIGPNEATLLLKQTPEYQTRFAGNVARVKAGMNALTEAQYLSMEDSYQNTLTAYGLKNYYGTDAKTRQAGMAAAIGGDISATEFADRVKTVVDTVQNADPQIKAQLQSFYNVNSNDLVKYYLDPTNNFAALQQKTNAAQIGAAAVDQGLTTNVANAEALAKFGVTQQQAIAGYGKVGDILPTANKLGQIYGQKYDQATAESEVFGTGTSAEAQRKRLALKQLEEGSFAGRSGVIGANVGAGYSGSLGKSIQGKF